METIRFGYVTSGLVLNARKSRAPLVEWNRTATLHSLSKLLGTICPHPVSYLLDPPGKDTKPCTLKLAGWRVTSSVSWLLISVSQLVLKISTSGVVSLLWLNGLSISKQPANITRGCHKQCHVLVTIGSLCLVLCCICTNLHCIILIYLLLLLLFPFDVLVWWWCCSRIHLLKTFCAPHLIQNPPAAAKSVCLCVESPRVCHVSVSDH